MDKLRFYEVEQSYIDELKAKEISKRGFTKVPDVNYTSHKKLLCGIVIKVSEINYYVPLTSYNIQRDDNFVIVDRGKNIASLRFNYMIPVPSKFLTVKDFKAVTDKNYSNLLYTELMYCNDNLSTILNKARRTYTKVIKGLKPQLIRNACDFKLLEKVCLHHDNQLESRVSDHSATFKEKLAKITESIKTENKQDVKSVNKENVL